MCPFQLLRSYKRHEENKSKSGQERSSMQQADFECHRPTQWMQVSVSMHKNPTHSGRHSRMNQATSEEREDRGQEADGKKGSTTKQNTSDELKQGLPRLLGTAKDNKVGAKVLGKNYVIALWIIYVFALSINLIIVIYIICDLITIIHMLTRPAQYDSYMRSLMEVIAAEKFFLNLFNAIVNACIIHNIMVTAMCTRIAVCRRKIIRIAIWRKMKNYYTLIIYLTSQKKCF